MLIIKFFRALGREWKQNKILGLTIVWRRVINKIYSFFFLRKYRITADCSSWITGLKYMQIGSLGTGRWCRIEMITEYNGKKTGPLLKVGNNVSFNDKVHIGCAKYIEIGDDCLFGSNIYVTDHYHGWYRGDKQSDVNEIVAKRDLGCEEVIIGKNVWVGENVTILPGSHIGDNVIIGANSVVKGNVPPNTIVVGVPAKVVKIWKDGKWERV